MKTVTYVHNVLYYVDVLVCLPCVKLATKLYIGSKYIVEPSCNMNLSVSVLSNVFAVVYTFGHKTCPLFWWRVCLFVCDKSSGFLVEEYTI